MQEDYFIGQENCSVQDKMLSGLDREFNSLEARSSKLVLLLQFDF